MDLRVEQQQSAAVSDEDNTNATASSASLNSSNEKPASMDDSGYNSGSSRESCDVDAGSTSFNIYDLSEDSSEEDVVGSKIEFIEKKQALLEKAAVFLRRERNYVAHTAVGGGAARETITGTDLRFADASIWTEAKEILRAISHKSSDSTMMPPKKRHSRKRAAESPRDPNIRLASVQTMPSRVFEKHSVAQVPNEEDIQLKDLPTVSFGGAQWVAKALVWSEPAQKLPDVTPEERNWKVVEDPITCSLGLIPPSCMSLKNAVDLQDAIGVTDQPRLVTQSAPPFFVVHVNRAFLLLAGMNDSRAFIGRPVEKFIQVTQTITSRHTCKENGRYLDSVIVTDKEELKPCRIRVHPVLDRSRRQRISRHRYACMSHVLITAMPSRDEIKDHQDKLVLAMESSSTSGSGSDDDNKSDQSQDTDNVVGTVG